MSRPWWMKLFPVPRTVRRAKAPGPRLAVCALEERTTPAVVGSLVGTTLTVGLNAAGDVANITLNAGSFEVRDGAVLVFSTPAAGVTAFDILGNAAGNQTVNWNTANPADVATLTGSAAVANVTTLTVNGNYVVVGALGVTLAGPGGGSFTDGAAGALTVGGAANINAGANRDVAFDNLAGHDFSTVATANAQNLTLRDGSALDLGAINASGSVGIAAASLTQSGPLTAGGAVTLTANTTLALGSVTSAATVTLAAGGAITDANGAATNVSAPALSLTAANGIGSGNALETAVGTVAAANTAAGNIQVTNAGALAVGTVGAVVGVTRSGAAAGNIVLSAASPLTVNAAVANNSGGDIVLTAVNDGGDDDHLTLNAKVMATGGNGSITLNAGTDLIVNHTLVGPDVATVGTGAITANVGRNTFLNANAALATAGGPVTITTNDLAIDATASVTSPGGVITITTTTPARVIDLGVAAVGTLGISAVELGRLFGATVRLGTGANTGGIAVTGAAATAAGVTTLSLTTAGTVTDSAAGALSAPILAIRGNTVVLDSGLHSAGTLAGAATGPGVTTFVYTSATDLIVGPGDGLLGVTSASGSVSLAGAATRTLTVNQPITATTTVDLTFDDMVLNAAVTAGTAARLTTTTAGRVIDLGTNTAGRLGLTDGELDFITAPVVRIGTVANTGGIVVSAPVNPSGTGVLSLTTAGAVADAGGTIAIANLAARGSTVTLGAGHAVGTLAGTAAGAFTFAGTIPLTIGEVDGTAGIVAGGPITIVADNLSITRPVNAGANAVSIRQRTAGRALNLGGADTPAVLGLGDDDLDFVTAGRLLVGDAATGPITVSNATTQAGSGYTTLIVESGAAINGTGSIAVTNLALRAISGIGVPGNPIATTASNLEAQTTTGGIEISNTGDLSIGGVDAGLSGVRVLAAGGITIFNAGSLSVVLPGETVAAPGPVSLTAFGAAADLRTGGGNRAPTWAVASTGGAVTLSAGRDLRLGGVLPALFGDVRGLGVTLSAGRDIVVDGDTFVDAFGAGAITATAGRDVTLTAISAGTGPRLSTAGGPITVTAASTFTLTALASPGVVSNGGDITITADAMTINRAITAGTGCVTLQQTTAARPVDLGTETPGALSLTDGELDLITASALRIGRADGAAISITAPITLSTAAAPPAVGTNTLVLRSAGAITENLAGTLSVANLVLQAGGAVNLGGANTIGRIAGSVGGTLTVRNTAGPLTVGIITACGTIFDGFATTGDVTITADDINIAAPLNAGAGCVTIQQETLARSIDLGTESAGFLSLTDDELDRITAGAGLRVGRDSATPGYTGAIRVSAAITQGPGYSALGLRAGGTVTETAGTLAVSNVAVQAGGAIALDNANAIGTIAATGPAGADISVTNGAGAKLTVGTVVVCGVPLSGLGNVTGDGDIVLTADDLDILAAVRGDCVTLRPFSAARDVDLGADGGPGNLALGLTDSDLDRVTATGGLRVGRNDAGFTGNLRVSGAITQAGSGYTALGLRAGGEIASTTGSLAVTTLAVEAGRAVNLTNTNAVATLAGRSGLAAPPAAADRVFRFVNGPTLTVATATVCGVALSGVVVPDTAVLLVSQAGAILLDQAVNAGANPVIRPTVRLQAAADIRQSAAGTITAFALGARTAGGSIVLDQANSVPVFAAVNGATPAAVILPISFRTATALTLDVVTADGALFAEVRGVTNNQAGSEVRLQAVGGVSQTPVGQVIAPVLGVRNAGAGDILLDAVNRVGVLAAANAAAGGRVVFVDDDALAVGTVSAAGTFATTRGITTVNGDVNLRTGTDFTAIDTNFADALFKLGTGTFLLNPGQDDPGTPELRASTVRTVTFNAEITAALARLGVLAAQPNSNPFRERFAVRPSANTPFEVNGNDPTTFPGDELTLLLDPTVTNLVFTPSVTPGSGGFTFGNRRPLDFTSIESLPQAAISAFAVQVGPRDVVILAQGRFGGFNSGLPFQPLAPAGNPFVVAPAQVNPVAPFSAPRLAVGDVNGDAVPDLILAAGSGSAPLVTVVSGLKLFGAQSGANVPLGPGDLIAQFFAYDPNFLGGVTVAAGDFNGDGKAEIVTGADAGGGPHVRTFEFIGGGGDRVRQYLGAIGSFFAYDPAFRGGVRVAAGDVNGDGRPDIVTGAGVGGGPHVKAFNGANGGLLKSFMAYDPAFRGGVYVDAGFYDGDTLADIITGPGQGGGPHVKVFSGATNAELASFNAFTAGGGVTPFPGDSTLASGVGGIAFTAEDLDGLANDILVTTGRGQPALARVFRGNPGGQPVGPVRTLIDDPRYREGAIPAIGANRLV